jgi:hypothetical protein
MLMIENIKSKMYVISICKVIKYFINDTPPSSLMVATGSPKVKTAEEGVGSCSLAHNISGVEGCAGTLGWD